MKAKEAIEKLSKLILYDKSDYVNDEVMVELDVLEASEINALIKDQADIIADLRQELAKVNLGEGEGKQDG